MGKSSKKDDGSGSKKEKKAKHKAKKLRQEPDHKKKKKSKRKHSSDSSSGDSSGSSSDWDTGPLSSTQQLRRDRQAVNHLRTLLWEHAKAKQDLRQLLWTIDQGKAANLAGMTDDNLKLQLKQLLKLLGLRKADAKGSYVLPPGQPTTLSLVGFVFEEQLKAPPPSRPAPTSAITPAAASAEPSTRTSHKKQRLDEDNTSEKAQLQQPSQPVSPVHRPAVDDTAGLPSSSRSQDPPDAAAGPPAGAVRRLGPMMPTPEMLAAAAAAAEQGVQPCDDEMPGSGDDEEAADLVGPVPPELQEELDAVPQDAREAEVLRILKVLREAAAQAGAAGALGGGGATAAAGAASVPATHAYQILGVESDTGTGEVKKRYMRLSLLIHPDKCQHKDAHEAFQAVAQAAKVLQDSGARAALDEALEDQQLRKMAAAAAAQMERQRQWQVMMGGGQADADMMQPVQAGHAPLVRESWMTELPPERQAAVGDVLNQVSKRAFNKTAVKPRGDTSAWTDTPQQRAAKGAGDMLQPGTAGPMLLTGRPGGVSVAGPAARESKVMDAYNSQARKKTLLEQHQELQEASKKAQVKKEDGTDKPPWRPFDKDKDLQLPRKAVDPATMLKNAQLGNKFTSSGGTRHFL